MSTTSVLTRVPFTTPLDGAFSRVELLAKAEKLIGYKPSSSSDSQKRAMGEVAMVKALKELEIEPFDKHSVEAYQADMIAKAKRKESWKLTRKMHGWEGESIAEKLGFVAWPACIVTFLATFVHAAITQASVEHWAKILLPSWLALPFTLALTWGFLMILRHKKAIEVNAQWYQSPIGNWQAPIPEFVINRMVDVKTALPEATFYVDCLNVQSNDIETKKTPPDPFLILDVNGARCYLDVWDEPTFEGRRRV